MANSNERQLISLASISKRWECSRQTVRRVMERHGARAIYLGGDSRNATLRFDLADVLDVEGRSQRPVSRT